MLFAIKQVKENLPWYPSLHLSECFAYYPSFLPCFLASAHISSPIFTLFCSSNFHSPNTSLQPRRIEASSHPHTQMGAEMGLLAALVALRFIYAAGTSSSWFPRLLFKEGAFRQPQAFMVKLCTMCGAEGCSGFRHLENGQTFFRYGGLLVIFRCHPGYKLHGYKTNSCVSGHWSRDTPVCVGEKLESWACTLNLFMFRFLSQLLSLCAFRG